MFDAYRILMIIARTSLKGLSFCCPSFKRLMESRPAIKPNWVHYFLICTLLLPGPPAWSQKTDTVENNKVAVSAVDVPAGLKTLPKTYVARHTNAVMKIDGKLTEPGWRRAPWTDEFVDILGASIPSSDSDLKKDDPNQILPTKVKMCWNDQYLFVAAELTEPQLWGNLTKRDAIIYNDNDFELFISPTGDTRNYFEIEVNARGTILDLFMTKPYRNNGRALISWNAGGIKKAVTLHGTLNKPGDDDSLWVVEMAIPFTALQLWPHKAMPAPEELWRINFSRVEWDLAVTDSGYTRKRDKYGSILAEHNWVWSPQGIKAMHAPERWGYLFFARDESYHPQVSLSELQKNGLWQLYYLQEAYLHKNNSYASNLGDLGISGQHIKVGSGETEQLYPLKMEATSRQFQIDMISPEGQYLFSIDNTGQITTNHPFKR